MSRKPYETDRTADAICSVFMAILAVIIGFCLFRLGQLCLWEFGQCLARQPF